MFVVWFLTGLWHGAAWNFVLWGLYYGVLLALEKFVYGRFLEKLPRIFRHVYAIIIVVLGFVLFVFDDMGELRRYFGVLFGMSDLPFWNGGLLWNLRNHALPLLMGLAFAFPLWPYLCEVYGNMQAQKDRRISYGKTAVSVLCSLLFAAVMTGLFLLTTAYLVNDTYNPFLYFRF
jgi:alginate O-acetyltransferase complex protein AlgI